MTARVALPKKQQHIHGLAIGHSDAFYQGI